MPTALWAIGLETERTEELAVAIALVEEERTASEAGTSRGVVAGIEMRSGEDPEGITVQMLGLRAAAEPPVWDPEVVGRGEVAAVGGEDERRGFWAFGGKG